jgi:hypothetical protein
MNSRPATYHPHFYKSIRNKTLLRKTILPNLNRNNFMVSPDNTLPGSLKIPSFLTPALNFCKEIAGGRFHILTSVFPALWDAVAIPSGYLLSAI